MITKEWKKKEITWLHAKKDDPWENKGGDYDRENCIVGEMSENSNEWETYDITSFVEYFHKNPEKNYGVFLYPAEEDMASVPRRGYASSRDEDQSLRPKLTVTYEMDSKIIFNKNMDGLCRDVIFMYDEKLFKVYIPFTGSYSCSIHRIDGKKIADFKGYRRTWHTVPVKDNPAGIYFLRLDHNGGSGVMKLTMLK